MSGVSLTLRLRGSPRAARALRPSSSSAIVSAGSSRITLPYMPHASRSRPRSNAASTIAFARSGVRSASSNASIGPSPRTSPIASWREARSSRRARRVVAEPLGPREELRLADGLEHGDRGGARKRVASERPAETPRRHGVHQLGAARDARQRQAAADRLAGDEEIGLDVVVVLDRPHLPGPPDARLHLVVDVQDPVLAADLSRGARDSRRAWARSRPRPEPARAGRRPRSAGRPRT